MKRIEFKSLIVPLVAVAAMMVSSCSREDRFSQLIYNGQEIYTVFNVSIAQNTKTKTKTKTTTKADTDSKTSYETEEKNASFLPDVAFGLVGVDKESLGVLVDNKPVYEQNGVRTANIIADIGEDTVMSVSAFYPYVKNVSYHKDGSYAVSFTPDDVVLGPLASNAVDMRCNQDFETVSIRFHHISNSIGFRVCDITDDEQLRGLMHIRKIILHGLPTEGMYVVDGENSHWVPNAKRESIVYYEGDDLVSYGEDNELFVAQNHLSASNTDCNRHYLVPEELKAGKHYVEVIFDVDPFDYDGTHYRGASGKNQTIPLSGVIPGDIFEPGLQYTFTLGINLGTVYRPIEFSANVDDWEMRYKARVLDFDNE
jgi:hypothetical protein